jgi:hypothetical protein
MRVHSLYVCSIIRERYRPFLHCFQAVLGSGRHSIIIGLSYPPSGDRIWLSPASRNNGGGFPVDVLLATLWYKSEDPEASSLVSTLLPTHPSCGPSGMANFLPSSVSRHSMLQPKQRAKASVSSTSIVACGGVEVPTKPHKSLVKSLRRGKPLKLDAISAPILADPSVPCTPTKKRARKDTLDENEASGDAGGRLPRVRQRLISTSSVATIRAHNRVKDVGRHKEGSSATGSRTSKHSEKPPGEPPRARPLSEINHDPGDPPQRRLRRVGTIEFPTMRAPDGDSSDPCNQSSRIAVPVRRVSNPLGDDPNALDRSRSSKEASRQGSEPSSYAVAAAAPPVLAPRTSVDRFDLRIAPVKVHTELWDLPDEYVTHLSLAEVGCALSSSTQRLARVAWYPRLDGQRRVVQVPADSRVRNRVCNACV